MIISIVHTFTCTADKKQDILEFFEQTNFEQMIPTRGRDLKTNVTIETLYYKYFGHIIKIKELFKGDVP